MYSGRDRITLGDVVGPDRRSVLAADEADTTLIDRQALHAHRLRFRHPMSEQEVDLTAPMPEDMERTLQALRTYRGA